MRTSAVSPHSPNLDSIRGARAQGRKGARAQGRKGARATENENENETEPRWRAALEYG